MQQRVLIVILNYLTYEMTLTLIDELQKLEYPCFDIMVVDNCSPNESAHVLEIASESKGYIFYKNENNSGYAAGNNIGIRYGIENGYAYTWILNNDVHLKDQDILMSMVSIAQEDEHIACIGPKIYDIDENICAPYCKRPNLWTMTLGIINDRKECRRQSDMSQKVYRVHGCCMLLKNSVMNEVDGLDERTFLYCEEEILAERMRKVGACSYYLADKSIIHMESSTVKQADKTKVDHRIKIVMQSMELYLKEYRGYNLFARMLCKNMRKLIMKLRG